MSIPSKEFPQREGAGGTPGPEEDDISLAQLNHQ